MVKSDKALKIPFPKGWKKYVPSAVLHVIALAQYTTIIDARGWAADSSNQRVRIRADLDRANQEIELLREELRIMDARLARIDPHRRPQYPPRERMAIVQLRAA